MKKEKKQNEGSLLQKLSSIENLLKKKDDKPLSFKEACTYLGYAPSYLYKLTSTGKIPHYKPTGKLLFFSKADLDDWVFGRYGDPSTTLGTGVKGDASTTLGTGTRSEDTSTSLSADMKGETGNVKKSKRNGGKK